MLTKLRKSVSSADYGQGDSFLFLAKMAGCFQNT